MKKIKLRLFSIFIILSLLVNNGFPYQFYLSPSGFSENSENIATLIASINSQASQSSSMTEKKPLYEIGFLIIHFYFKCLQNGKTDKTLKGLLIDECKSYFLKSKAQDFHIFLDDIKLSLEQYINTKITDDKNIQDILVQAFTCITQILKDVHVRKDESFFAEFMNKYFFIDTNDIDLKEGETITIVEMLKRYSKKFQDKLPDPETVLIVANDHDPRLFFKRESFNFKNHCSVKRGEYYWVVYQHPKIKPEESALMHHNIFLRLGDLSQREQTTLDKQLKHIGDEIYFNEDKADNLINEWLNEDNNKMQSKLQLAKKLILYFHKRFGHEEFESIFGDKYEFSSLFAILEYLVQDKEVQDWMAEVFKLLYFSGEYIKDHMTYSNEFNLLAYFLVKNRRKDIYPIAIHSFVEMRVFIGRSHRKIPMFIRAMRDSDDPDIKKAYLLKSTKFIKDIGLDKGFSNNIHREVFDYFIDVIKYITYLAPYEKFNIGYTSDEYNIIQNLGRIVGKMREKSLLKILDALIEDKNPLIKEKLLLFLEAIHIHLYATHNESVCKRWIDAFIDCVQKEIPLREIFETKRIIDKYKTYRKNELSKALLILLNNPQREDIDSILSILRLYKNKKAQEIIVRHYLKKDSPFIEDAFSYMIDMKDPVYFDKVWEFVLKLEEDEISKNNMLNIDYYCIHILENKEKKALNEHQKDKIKKFAEKHILNKSFKDFAGDESDEHFISFGGIWIVLAGLFKRDDKVDELKEIIEDPKKVKIFAQEALLPALLHIASKESLTVLNNLNIELLKESDTKNILYNFIKKLPTDGDRNTRRKLFTSLIQASIINQLKNDFSKITNIFIFRDPEGADILFSSDILENVDITDINLYYEVRKVNIFLPQKIRNNFKKRFMSLLSRETPLEHVNQLELIDDESEFLERMRYKIRTILKEELRLKEDEIEGKFKRHRLSSIFLQLMWQGSQEKDEQLSALYLLKPLKDVVNLNLGLTSITNNDGKVQYIYEKLLEYDPTFYKHIKEQIKAYLRWLVEKDIIKNESSLIINNFGCYFILAQYSPIRFHGEEIITQRVNELGTFLREHMLSYFYPEGLKDEDKSGFRHTFLRCLGALWVKDVLKRRKESHVGVVVIPLLPIFEEDTQKIVSNRPNPKSEKAIQESH